MKFYRQSATKFIGTCQYLKGKEIAVKRIDGTQTKGIVKSIGAFSWYPKSSKCPIEVYANIEIGKGSLVKVDLYALYKLYPAGAGKKELVAPPQELSGE